MICYLVIRTDTDGMSFWEAFDLDSRDKMLESIDATLNTEGISEVVVKIGYVK